jgi:hypothetical protein
MKLTTTDSEMYLAMVEVLCAGAYLVRVDFTLLNVLVVVAMAGVLTYVLKVQRSCAQ